MNRKATNDRLVQFLYLLMRDHVVPGDIARLVKEKLGPPGFTAVLTNGGLGDYAEHIAAEIRGEEKSS